MRGYQLAYISAATQVEEQKEDRKKHQKTVAFKFYHQSERKFWPFNRRQKLLHSSLKMAEEPKMMTRSMSRRFYRFESLAEQLAEVLGRQQSNPNLWVFEVAWEVANKG